MKCSIDFIFFKKIFGIPFRKIISTNCTSVQLYRLDNYNKQFISNLYLNFSVFKKQSL